MVRLELIKGRQIFSYPGKKFNVVDAMITNFHLPKSTLIMLVSAFANKHKIMQAYHHAIAKNIGFSAMVMRCLFIKNIISIDAHIF